nr:hypothetical protein [Desulfosarcina cetonica]
MDDVHIRDLSGAPAQKPQVVGGLGVMGLKGEGLLEQGDGPVPLSQVQLGQRLVHQAVRRTGLVLAG